MHNVDNCLIMSDRLLTCLNPAPMLAKFSYLQNIINMALNWTVESQSGIS